MKNAQQLVRDSLKLPIGYSINWSGQYEYLQRAKEKLKYVIPLTLFIIALLLFINFRNLAEVTLLMGTLPFALVGGIWLMYWHGFNFSIAVAVGFIALAGVSIEIGIIMLLYLNQARSRLAEDLRQKNIVVQDKHLKEAIMQGAGMRIRPVMMTASTIIVGLLPILYASGTGSEVMSRIAAPMVGGMLSSVLLILLVLPVIYYLWHRRFLIKDTDLS